MFEDFKMKLQAWWPGFVCGVRGHRWVRDPEFVAKALDKDWGEAPFELRKCTRCGAYYLVIPIGRLVTLVTVTCRKRSEKLREAVNSNNPLIAALKRSGKIKVHDAGRTIDGK
jgi:hypothetical protein